MEDREERRSQGGSSAYEHGRAKPTTREFDIGRSLNLTRVIEPTRWGRKRI